MSMMAENITFIKENAEKDKSNKEVILRLDKITKLFGNNRAVNELSLDVNKGEIFTLLGPSGCGKTTTLRQIAGLENPDSGVIYFRDKVIVSPSQRINVPPHKRKMGMVFQSYAIWPHLSVFETVAYPLHARKIPTGEIKSRVMAILELVGLKGMEDRPGPALSGGQQQRVAVARALVYEPEILLLDEPFSNLDVKLREQMRVELKQLQRRVGVTVILVTHDQIEALSFSDRIAIINQGNIEQVGTPMELYNNPKSKFVRDFIGKSISLDANIETVDNNTVNVYVGNGINTVLTAKNNRGLKVQKEDQVTLSIRPEDILVHVRKDEYSQNVVQGVIETLLFIGDRFECHVRIGNETFLVYASKNRFLKEGQHILLHFPPEELSIWILE